MLTLFVQVKTYNRIAEELHISYKTVVNISVQLKKKLDVNTLPALVQRAVQLLSPTDVSDSRLQ